MNEAILERLREICLAYPDASEGGGVGNPSWRVRDKIFAMRHDLHKGQWSCWCKVGEGMQAMLVESEPERYFIPPYVGKHGWIGFWLDDALDWVMIADLIDRSYRLIAPKRLVKVLDGN
jgi:hypothetical protein